MPAPAPRMDRIVGSATVEIGRLVAQKRQEGADVIGLSLGEPDFATPQHIIDAAKQALDDGHTHYTPGPGIPALRDAVARTHRETNSIPCQAEDVLVTPTKQAVMMSIMALADRGDEVLLPDPGWVSYAPITQWAHATPVPVPSNAAEDFRMTPDAVAERITDRTKVVLLNSPSNPTGAINSADDVRGIVDLAIDHDLWIISDEIYQRLIYEGDHVSPASLPDAFHRTITIDGMSKAYAMTGWRLGWLVAPRPAWQEINKLQSHSVTHCTSFAQYGGVAALEGPQECVEEMRGTFSHRRRVVLERLQAMEGVEVAKPHGAFYVFPRFDAAGDDEAFCKRLIVEAGVAGTPGSAFGEAGRGHLRLSYAASEETLQEAMDRIEAFL